MLFLSRYQLCSKCFYTLPRAIKEKKKKEEGGWPFGGLEKRKEKKGKQKQKEKERAKLCFFSLFSRGLSDKEEGQSWFWFWFGRKHADSLEGRKERAWVFGFGHLG